MTQEKHNTKSHDVWGWRCKNLQEELSSVKHEHLSDILRHWECDQQRDYVACEVDHLKLFVALVIRVD